VLCDAVAAGSGQIAYPLRQNKNICLVLEVVSKKYSIVCLYLYVRLGELCIGIIPQHLKKY